MNTANIPIEQLKVASYMKISKELMLSHSDIDFDKDLMTAQLIGYVYSISKQVGTIDVHVQRPTFLDWLLRRTKVLKQHYVINHLIKPDQLPTFPSSLSTLPIIQFNTAGTLTNEP